MSLDRSLARWLEWLLEAVDVVVVTVSSAPGTGARSWGREASAISIPVKTLAVRFAQALGWPHRRGGWPVGLNGSWGCEPAVVNVAASSAAGARPRS